MAKTESDPQGGPCKGLGAARIVVTERVWGRALEAWSALAASACLRSDDNVLFPFATPFFVASTSSISCEKGEDRLMGTVFSQRAGNTSLSK